MDFETLKSQIWNKQSIKSLEKQTINFFDYCFEKEALITEYKEFLNTKNKKTSKSSQIEFIKEHFR